MNSEHVMIQASEPIFPVADVVATTRYYCSVLGFQEHWLWGDPPDFGGVRWGKIGVMFSQQSSTNASVGGQWHSFFVDGIDQLYERHQQNGAEIVSPLEQKPWGMREYTVRDLNGHFLRFGRGGSSRSDTAGRKPATSVSIIERLPTLEEHYALAKAVGWARNPPDENAEKALAAVRCGVVAVEEDRVVGTGLVLGDGYTFAYLKDIMVHPEWQGRKIGSSIVERLLEIIRRSDPDEMLVTLFTGPQLAEFYERFGFRGPEFLYGMTQNITRSSR